MLHEQPHICRHQVDAALQTEPFTDERGFQDDFLPIEDRRLPQAVIPSAKQQCHRLTEMVDALLGISPEVRGIEALASAILQSLFPETAGQAVGQAAPLVVDNVVEGCIGEVTQQDGLGIGPLLQTVDGIEQRVVSVVGEAGGNGRDVDEEVGLHHNQARPENGQGHKGASPLCVLHIKQVQLHPLTDHLSQIGMVDALFLIQVVDGDLAVLGVGIDIVLVTATDDTADIAVVHASALLTLTVLRRNQPHQAVGDVHAEDSRDEETESPHVVEQVLTAEWRLAVGVAAHRLNGNLVAQADAAPLAEIVHLREHVAVGLPRIAQSLGTAEHQRLVHIAVGVARRLHRLCQLSASLKEFFCLHRVQRYGFFSLYRKKSVSLHPTIILKQL